MSDEGPIASLYGLPDYARGIDKDVSPRVTSDADLKLLESVGKRFPRLKKIMGNSAVVQSPDEGDGRLLEYYDPEDTDSPTPGKTTFQMFQKFDAPGEREDAIAADALHSLPRNDPKWRDLRSMLIDARPAEQRRIDDGAYLEDHDPGQSKESWMERNRADAYVRGGLFPDRNPEWNQNENGKEPWTPEQQHVFELMRAYLGKEK